MAGRSIVILLSPYPEEAALIRESLRAEGLSMLRWRRRGRLPARSLGTGRVRAVVADLDCFRRIRIPLGVRRRPPIPLIILPSHFDWRALVLCLNRGATDYLQRPLRHDDFLPTLRLSDRLVEGLARGAPCLRARLVGPHAVEILSSSHEEQVTRISRFLFLLAGSVLPEPTRMDVRLGVDEIGRNAVEWGNRLDPRKTFRLRCTFERDRVKITVRDKGAGFDAARTLDLKMDPLALAEIREAQGKRPGGLGLKLVHTVMDEMRFGRKGSEVTLVKRLPPGTEAR